jgi:phosphopantetheinyl transferase (holo-ACP synthase)
MHIGNDLMILNPINDHTFQRKGAEKVVLTEPERETFLYCSRETLQEIWTIKEAAYKYFSKCGIIRKFSPQDYRIVPKELNSLKSGKVFSGKDFCYFYTFHYDNYIHSICTNTQDMSAISLLIIPENESPEEKIKILLNCSKVHFGRDDNGIPFIEHNSCCKADISISSDENFAAYALIKSE